MFCFISKNKRDAIISLTICLIFFFSIADSQDKKSYDGYKLISAEPKTSEDVKALRQLEEGDLEVDFWTGLKRIGRRVDLMVSDENVGKVIHVLNELKIYNRIVVDNVQSLLEQKSIRKRTVTENTGFNFNDFNTLEDLYSWIDNAVNECPDDRSCTVSNIGETHEGRPIKAIQIKSVNSSRKKRPTFWVDATIHAREWISTATSLLILKQLITSESGQVKRMLERFDWFIIPVLNPDGYAYSHTHERLWRKNRSLNPNSLCIGTDLNRNYDFEWGGRGSSRSPCSIVYAGPSAASELETQAIQNEMKRLRPKVLASLHAYGQLWLLPYGVNENEEGESCKRDSSYREMIKLANFGAEAIENTYNTSWVRGASCEVMYLAPGTSVDYAKAVAGVPFPFCLELRGDSFLIDSNEIEKSFNETWNGLDATVRFLTRRRRRNRW